ncbi:MAG: heme ABC exporter ATP-binding protein CcmA [Acidobacteriota bacterium]
MSVDFTDVAVSDLGRHFGRRKALSQISFACHAGELIGLLGPNGAGKSTLLAVLATLLTPSTGRVAYGGFTATAAGAGLRARIGLLGHDVFLYPELTARENLLFFARLYGLGDARPRVEASLASAGLVDRADDVVSGFSRGMRQRLALERALVHEPRLVLLDEPFTGLDQASAELLTARLRALQTAGCLVILATHDLDAAEGLFTRVIFLRQGRMLRSEEGGERLRGRYQTAMDVS